MAADLSNPCTIKQFCNCLEEAKALVTVGQVYPMIFPGPIAGVFKVLNVFCKRNKNGVSNNILYITVQNTSTNAIVTYPFFEIDPVTKVCKLLLAIGSEADCDTNPITYSGIVFIRVYAQDTGNTEIDRTYIKASIEESAIGGGYPPYTIEGWYCNDVVAFTNDIEPFDNTREYNYVRRKPSALQQISSGLSIGCSIRDALGCVKQLGNTVTVEDMRCVGLDGDFTVNSITSTSMNISLLSPSFPTGGLYKITINGNFGTFYDTSNTNDHVITGLTANTTYEIGLQLECTDGSIGRIGPMTVTTLP